MQLVFYDRAPSAALRQLLAPGGMLALLHQLPTVKGQRLDVHFRERDHVHVYCGLTRLLDFALVGERLRVGAEDTYRQLACAAGLFRDWTLDETDFASTLERYLKGVEPEARWLLSEGAVQSAWSGIRGEWTPIDREVVLAYRSLIEGAMARSGDQFAQAREELTQVQRTEGWAQLPSSENGRKLDQMAIDRDGNLVLIELKFARASEPTVYYAPLQLLQYVHEWQAALAHVMPGLEELRRARMEVGLSPRDTPRLSGKLRAVLGFGDDDFSPKVKARLYRVWEIMNRYLPHRMNPIELWALRSGNNEPTLLTTKRS